MSGYNWSSEDVYKLIDMFRAREVLWNPLSEDYKNRGRKHQAWIEIANEFNLDPIVTEKKIRSLVGQFYRECKTKSGADGSSKWFAFQKLMFLKDRKPPRSKVDGEMQGNEETSSGSENTLNDTVDEVFATPKPFRKRKQPEEPSTYHDTTQHEALNILRSLCEAKKPNRDESDAFGEYVSMKLKQLNNSNARNTTQHLINNILYNASMGQYDFPTNTREPTASSSLGYNSAQSPTGFSESSQDSTHSLHDLLSQSMTNIKNEIE